MPRTAKSQCNLRCKEVTPILIMKLKFERRQQLWKVANATYQERGAVKIGDIQQNNAITPCTLCSCLFN